MSHLSRNCKAPTLWPLKCGGLEILGSLLECTVTRGTTSSMTNVIQVLSQGNIVGLDRAVIAILDTVNGANRPVEVAQTVNKDW